MSDFGQAVQQTWKRPRKATGYTDGTTRARATIYYALAEALADPIPGLHELLLEAVTVGTQILNSPACQKAALILTELPVTAIETLRSSYTHLIANPGRRPVALYESLHRRGDLIGEVTWEIERYYRALGLVPVGGELPDHASVELAFLGHLLTAEAEARLAGEGRLVARLRAEQRTFLSAHAGVWLPEVGVALAAADHRFYAAVGRLLSGFLAEEMIGRQRNGQTGVRLPTLTDPNACTLCGLCVGSCSPGALRVIENSTQTALTLNPARCIGCRRCVRICPEEVLVLSYAPYPDNRANPAGATGHQIMRQSLRARCPNCRRPTVSQVELDAIFARLQPDLAMQQRLGLCIECKSRNA